MKGKETLSLLIAAAALLVGVFGNAVAAANSFLVWGAPILAGIAVVSTLWPLASKVFEKNQEKRRIARLQIEQQRKRTEIVARIIPCWKRFLEIVVRETNYSFRKLCSDCSVAGPGELDLLSQLMVKTTFTSRLLPARQQNPTFIGHVVQ